MSAQSADVVIRPTPPFRLDLTVWALRRRARNIVDRWDGITYNRLLVIDSDPIDVSVTQAGRPDRPTLHIRTPGSTLDNKRIALLKALVKRVLGTDIDLGPFYRLAEQDEQLGQLAWQFRGLKPPRFPTLFEALVNAISCQQLSLTVGIELLNRLTRECGLSSSTGERAFPRPSDILLVSPETFRQLGYSRQKASFVLSLAGDVKEHHFDSERLDCVSTDSAREALLKLRGVGRWTAEYALLRGLRRLDVFPGDDVGARNGLKRWLHRTEQQLDYTGIQKALSRWKSYAGFIYFHLLLEGLTRSREMTLGPNISSVSSQKRRQYAEHPTSGESFTEPSGRALAG